jgi:hypothetical protein
MYWRVFPERTYAVKKTKNEVWDNEVKIKCEMICHKYCRYGQDGLRSHAAVFQFNRVSPIIKK